MSFTFAPKALLTECLALANMRLNPAEQRLYGDHGALITLERKAFDLLCYLVAQRARVVGKDELLQHVWGRSIASDTVIAQAVSKARKALASGGGDAEWIDVIRGVGYRYVGPAEVTIPTTGTDAGADAAIPIAGTEAAQPTVARRRPRWGAYALLAAGAIAGVFAGMAWQRQVLLRDPLRVAVLPLRDDSADAALGWSSLGLQGLLVDALANDRRITPLAQGNVHALLAARPDLVDPQAQAEYLTAATGVNHVYAGRLAREGDGLVVELVLLGSDATESTRRVGHDAANLALAAADDLTRRLLPGFDPARPAPMSAVAFANEALARGLDARMRGRAAEAVALLGSALDADPGLLAARYQLSVAYQLLRDNAAWKRTLDDLLQRARAGHNRTYQGLGLVGSGVLAWREGRFTDAESLLRDSTTYFDAAADQARLASVRGNLGSLAAIQGRFEQAEAEMRAALAVFEASGMQVEVARVSKNLGVLETDRGRFEAARVWFERSRALRQALGLERDLAETLVSLGTADIGLEAPAVAQASLERAAEIFVRYRDPLLESDALARLALAQIAQGRLTDAAESAGRSLAAARSADNASARGLAHLRLASIAALREDQDGARTELDRAEQAMRAGNDRKGLARVALDRLALASDTDTTAVNAVLAEVSKAGWRSLEAELLALRAMRAMRAKDRSAAHTDFAAAYALAQSIGEPALVTDLACRYAAAAPDLEDAAQTAAVTRCLAAAARHAGAARWRAQREEATGNADAARNWWTRSRELAGETWSALDQRHLEPGDAE